MERALAMRRWTVEGVFGGCLWRIPRLFAQKAWGWFSTSFSRLDKGKMDSPDRPNALRRKVGSNGRQVVQDNFFEHNPIIALQQSDSEG